MAKEEESIKKIERDTAKIYEMEKSILRIEKRILGIQELLEKELDLQQERNTVFRWGIEGLKQHLKDKLSGHKIDVRHKLFEVYRNDVRLRYPHEKILKVLVSKYDGHVFGFMNFNKIVECARIGKNKASEYLSSLEELGYISARRIGKRHLYKINVRVLEKELEGNARHNGREIEALVMEQQEEAEDAQ